MGVPASAGIPRCRLRLRAPFALRKGLFRPPRLARVPRSHLGACLFGHWGVASSPCAFSGAQGWFGLLAFGYVAIGLDLGGRVLGPVGTGPRLSAGLCTKTGAPSLPIASSSRIRSTPGRGTYSAQDGDRPPAPLSSRCPRRQTVGPETGAAVTTAVRSSPISIELLSAASRCSHTLVVDEG